MLKSVCVDQDDGAAKTFGLILIVLTKHGIIIYNYDNLIYNSNNNSNSNTDYNKTRQNILESSLK